MKEGVTHILDTSALVAHYRGEAGFDVVEALVTDGDNQVRVSSATWPEFRIKLVVLTLDTAKRSRVLREYQILLGDGIPADDVIAARAHELKEAAEEHLPNIDALIAATAASHDAILVHRDPHMSAIPVSSVAQLVLPDKATAANA